MKAPENWPFATWLDLDEVAKDATAALIVPLQKDYLDFAHSFLYESTLFSRPDYFQRVLYGLTGDLYLGAVSSEAYDPPGYAIGIYAGAWLQLLLCFQRLLAARQVLAEYSTLDNANKTNLQGETPSLGLVLLTPQGIETLFHENAAAPPIDPGKATVLRELIALGCRFLFLHEFVHVHGYHVDYLLARDPSTRSPDIERHGLEHLADLGAAIWAAHLATFTGTIKAKERNSSKREVIVAQLRLQGFAAGVISLLLEVLNPYVQSNYPAAGWRAIFLRVGASGSPAEFVGPLCRRDVLDAIANGFEHALEAWDLLGWHREHLSVSLAPQAIGAQSKAQGNKEYVDDYITKVMDVENLLKLPEVREIAACAGRRPLVDAAAE